MDSHDLPASVEPRFWAKVRKSEGCWEWTGARTAPGWHGVMGIHGQHRAVVHRVSWQLHYGPIPEGMLVCHHCDNPPCVRPDHLFLGTQRDNSQDASRKGRLVRVLRTHCKRGHPFEGNTYIHPSTGRRTCRTCHIRRAVMWHQKWAAMVDAMRRMQEAVG